MTLESLCQPEDSRYTARRHAGQPAFEKESYSMVSGYFFLVLFFRGLVKVSFSWKLTLEKDKKTAAMLRLVVEGNGGKLSRSGLYMDHSDRVVLFLNNFPFSWHLFFVVFPLEGWRYPGLVMRDSTSTTEVKWQAAQSWPKNTFLSWRQSITDYFLPVCTADIQALISQLMLRKCGIYHGGKSHTEHLGECTTKLR